jgi:hypothetical protein
MRSAYVTERKHRSSGAAERVYTKCFSVLPFTVYFGEDTAKFQNTEKCPSY